MKNKILYSIIIIFVITLAVLLCSSKTEAAIIYDDNISYTINADDTISVQASGKDIESITIPEKIIGKTVTGISKYRF